MKKWLSVLMTIIAIILAFAAGILLYQFIVHWMIKNGVIPQG